MSDPCAVDLATILDYWLGELEDREDAFEEHLLGCDRCARRVQLVAAIADGVARTAGRAGVFASVTADHLDRLAANGLRLRTYRIAPGGSVHCTIAPDDDANIVRLAAEFPPSPVDLRVAAIEAGGEPFSDERPDIAIDRTTNEAILVYPGDAIRQLPETSFRLELVGRADARVLGTYTMHHRPWS